MTTRGHTLCITISNNIAMLVVACDDVYIDFIISPPTLHVFF